MLGAATSVSSVKMENDASIDLDSIDWDTEDELEVFGAQDPSSSNPSTGDNLLVNEEVVQDHLEANTSAGSSNGKLIEKFINMGFEKDLIYKAIAEIGKDVDEPESAILDTLLTFTTLANSHEGSQFHESSSDDLQAFYKSQEELLRQDYNQSLSPLDYEDCNGFSDSDILSDSEMEDQTSEKDRMFRALTKMGYTESEASLALERCGPNATLSELTDCICAHQFAREQDLYLPDDKPRMRPSNGECAKLKKRRMFSETYDRKKMRGSEFVEELLRLPNPMVGFGLPSHPDCVTQRTLPEKAVGPPFFYYENVAMTPKGVWDTISSYLYGVEPEFVDSKYFCAAARKRGYVHNLPISNRYPLIPAPPFTIHDAFPLTKKWWPKWDTRTKLNCLQTAIGSAKLQEKIRKAVEDFEGDPPLTNQKYVLDQCRKWNLVWVGRNKVAPLEPDEVEILLGFPKNHTRGGGTSRTERYKSLGNSFQVDTVAYHLSVLKPLFPHGINVLSLFSGIGGAEVALHRLGIPLNNVVSVEKSEVNQNILRCWWEQTNQKGNLSHLDDVQALGTDELERLIASTGGFDLVIGGSPCNNLAGSNRVSRDGLEGKESALFYDYFRILEIVKSIMARRRGR